MAASRRWCARGAPRGFSSAGPCATSKRTATARPRRSSRRSCARWQAWMALATRNPNVVCIPNAVAPPAAPVAAREDGLVAFVGKCDAAKGIFDLLDAIVEIPGARLICAGDGDLEAVRRRAAELGLASRVKLAGWIGPGARADLLRICSVFVLPSHAEGVPMSLLEAMAAGCPAVASAVGGIP